MGNNINNLKNNSNDMMNNKIIEYNKDKKELTEKNEFLTNEMS